MRLLARVRSRDPSVAVRTDDRTLSWADLDDASRAFAGHLRARGVVLGDRVALYAHNSPDVVVALLACHRMGAVYVPINPGYQAQELAHIVDDSGARVLLQDADLLLRGAPDGAGDSDGGREEDVGLLIYTSGTTGKSKGCALTFANVTAAVDALASLWEIGPADEIVHALPLFHVHGLCVALHAALLKGARTRLLPKFTPAAVVEGVRAGGTVFMGVPTMYRRLLDHLDAHPDDGAVLARARLFTAGSAALPAADLEEFARHTGHRILERYGMSETLITLSNPLHGERRAGTVGKPVPGVEVRVLDDELWVRGPGVMRGYWPGTAGVDETGWLRTGDLVSVDADGYVRVVGRVSTDILKVGGYKIATREIEEQIAAIAGVREVAVVGVPDATWGQRVVACVVADRALTLAEVQAEVRLHEAKKPRALIVLEELPRNAMGKVLKKTLADMVLHRRFSLDGVSVSVDQPIMTLATRNPSGGNPMANDAISNRPANTVARNIPAKTEPDVAPADAKKADAPAPVAPAVVEPEKAKPTAETQGAARTVVKGGEELMRSRVQGALKAQSQGDQYMVLSDTQVKQAAQKIDELKGTIDNQKTLVVQQHATLDKEVQALQSKKERTVPEEGLLQGKQAQAQVLGELEKHLDLKKAGLDAAMTAVSDGVLTGSEVKDLSVIDQAVRNKETVLQTVANQADSLVSESLSAGAQVPALPAPANAPAAATTPAAKPANAPAAKPANGAAKPANAPAAKPTVPAEVAAAKAEVAKPLTQENVKAELKDVRAQLTQSRADLDILKSAPPKDPAAKRRFDAEVGMKDQEVKLLGKRAADLAKADDACAAGPLSADDQKALATSKSQFDAQTKMLKAGKAAFDDVAKLKASLEKEGGGSMDGAVNKRQSAVDDAQHALDRAKGRGDENAVRAAAAHLEKAKADVEVAKSGRSLVEKTFDSLANDGVIDAKEQKGIGGVQAAIEEEKARAAAFQNRLPELDKKKGSLSDLKDRVFSWFHSAPETSKAVDDYGSAVLC